MNANVEAHAMGKFSFDFARAEAPFGAVQACGNLPASQCVDLSTNSVSRKVAPKAAISLDVFAVGAFDNNPTDFTAVADPVVSIDDELFRPPTSISATLSP
jgi:hypothetical protein